MKSSQWQNTEFQCNLVWSTYTTIRYMVPEWRYSATLDRLARVLKCTMYCLVWGARHTNAPVNQAAKCLLYSLEWQPHNQFCDSKIEDISNVIEEATNRQLMCQRYRSHAKRGRSVKRTNSKKDVTIGKIQSTGDCPSHPMEESMRCGDRHSVQ